MSFTTPADASYSRDAQTGKMKPLPGHDACLPGCVGEEIPPTSHFTVIAGRSSYVPVDSPQHQFA